MPLIEAGLSLARRLADPHLTAWLLAIRWFAANMEGDHEAAARDAAESVLLYRLNLGLAGYLSGSPGAAESLFAESLDLARRAQMKASTADALTGLAMARRGGANMGRSARLHGAAGQALAALGGTLEPLEGKLRDLDCQHLRSAMGAEVFAAEYAAEQALTSEQILALAPAGQA